MSNGEVDAMRITQFMPDAYYDRINELMAEREITPKQLAKKLKVSNNTVYDWVRDMRVMSTVNFFEVCKFFDVNASWLYGITDKRTTYKGE
ncbi:MAG: helix-turn-helix transcriptional regulator [Bacteroidales bacterium]|nr:helix-turn-helix transcriptional regulator [Candidatus Scybalousia scybalohippi]